MKHWCIVLLLTFCIGKKALAQQRVIAECTIVYNITVDTTATNNSLIENLKSATKTIYIKGNNCRIDLASPAFVQSIFFDKTKGTATILREFGSNKFITKLGSDKWLNQKKEFDSMQITITKDTKKFLGYDCKKALLKLKDGKSYQAYFTPTLLPSVREYEYEFKDIPGLVLAYQVQSKNGNKINYTATKVNMNPVPASKFDIPSTGYRLLEK